MTVKELIETLKTCDEKSEVKVEHWNSTISPIEAVPMTAREANDKGYKLEDPTGDTLKENDIKRFIKGIENVKVGTKTTNTTLTCLTGFEVHGQAACVKPENFDLNVGSNYARIKAKDKIWKGLGFVLQWAKYGLKK